MGGKAIATVCQMFAEEFIAGGLPDLVVWRMSDKTVRFCEVKGPGGECILRCERGSMAFPAATETPCHARRLAARQTEGEQLSPARWATHS